MRTRPALGAVLGAAALGLLAMSPASAASNDSVPTPAYCFAGGRFPAG